MNHSYAYTTESYEAETDAKTYVGEFRSADYFLTLCRQCRNYGRRHGCPPFDADPLLAIKDYSKVKIIGLKIIPADSTLPLEEANRLMEPVTRQLNDELLEMERRTKGKAFGFVGTCPYCGDDPCARIKGEPCRHPDKVRPSLEAIGFDVSKTASHLLGLEMRWSKGDVIPEYLTLVCGLFYGRDK